MTDFGGSGALLGVVPGAGFEPATSGPLGVCPFCSPDYESGALARLGYPGGPTLAIWISQALI